MKIAAPPVEPQHARANRDERNERDRKPALKNVGLHWSRFVNFYYLLCAAQSLLLKVSYADCDESRGAFALGVIGHWLRPFVLPHYLIKPAVCGFGFVGQFYLNRYMPDIEALAQLFLKRFERRAMRCARL